MQKYILEGDTPRAVDDLMEWAKWFETAKRQLFRTVFPGGHISTVFLGLDHSYDGGPPILFETMIFGGPHDGYQVRCSTFEQARAMHAVAEEVTKFPGPEEK